MNTRNKIEILAVMLIGVSLSVIAQEDHVRKYSETYPTNASTLLEVESKYGDVEIRNWDKNEVAIYAEIILKDLSKQKADQIFQYVNIDISKSGNTIHVETEFEDNFFRMVNRNHSGNDGSFKINYTIKMPANLRVDLHNKYGNLFIDELASASNLSVKYGNLKINRLTGQGKENMATVDLGYSNATIEECTWLKLNAKYSKMNIEKSKALIVVSKYSKLNVELGSSLVSESKYDTYVIGKLSNFVAEAEYSNFKFRQLNKKLLLETKYTDVSVEYIPAGFEAIRIENSYGSMKFGIADDASYYLDGEARYAKISYPETGRVSRFQENTELTVKGLVGTDSEGAGKVKIETNYGGIKLNW